MANEILIGKKPLMSYVLACMTQFHGGAKKVTIKARGKAISRAVDVAEIIRHRFVTEAKVAKITVGTQEMTNPKTKKLQGVSTIEIVLTR